MRSPHHQNRLWVSMKINAGLVLELRNRQSWSQEELALAAGVNLRTIQRIEKECSGLIKPDTILGENIMHWGILV